MLSMTAPTHFNRAALPPGIARPYGPGVLGGPDALICTLLCKVAPIQSKPIDDSERKERVILKI